MSLEQFNPPARLFFFSKSKYVSLTFGTEPLMFKDFHLFINELDKYAIPSTHFITNGLFLNEEIIKASTLSNLGAITHCIGPPCGLSLSNTIQAGKDVRVSRCEQRDPTLPCGHRYFISLVAWVSTTCKFHDTRRKT